MREIAKKAEKVASFTEVSEKLPFVSKSAKKKTRTENT